MNRISHLIRIVHRILGTLLSAVFLMWFLTGMVMLFHGSFPSADRTDRLDLLSESADEFPAIDSLTQGRSFTTITLERYLGTTAFHITTADSIWHLLPCGQAEDTQVDAAYLDRLCQRWCPYSIAQCDTLTDLDQWVPFGKNRAELPILKYQFTDPDQHQLYVGSKTGNVLQFTSQNERVWAWLSTIPHWVYFTWLRSDRDLWKQVVVWISGIGCLMVISGIWTGISVWMQARRQKQGHFSPYKKKWYHWHYVTGFVFGLFCLTYVFSGMMSLVKLPPAVISTPQLPFNPKTALDETVPQTYLLDYRTVLAAQPQAVSVTWKHVGRIPFYTVLRQDGTAVHYDARSTRLVEMDLSLQDALTEVQQVYQQQRAPAQAATAEMLHTPELYYYRVKGTGKDVLPVIKVALHDVDNGLFYINPSNGAVRYIDTTGRWTYWLYLGLHKLRLPGLMHAEWLRLLLSLIILTGGTCVSLSGVVLGCRYLRRILKI